jgi:hypothetical protein
LPQPYGLPTQQSCHQPANRFSSDFGADPATESTKLLTKAYFVKSEDGATAFCRFNPLKPTKFSGRNVKSTVSEASFADYRLCKHRNGDRRQVTELSREEALAAALGEYRREADRHGPYRGYLAEAYELIRRLEEQGYTITSLKSAEPLDYG